MMQLGLSEEPIKPYGKGWTYIKRYTGIRQYVFALRRDRPGVSFKWLFWLN